MSPVVEWWPVGLAVAGVVFSLVNAHTRFRLAVNATALLSIVRKLVAAGQYERLRMLTNAAPNAELMKLTRRWLELDLPEVVHAPSSAGYREPAEVVPLDERTREALTPYVDERRAKLATQLPLSAVGIGLAAAGTLAAPSGAVLALAGFAGLFAIYGGLGVWQLRRDLLTALDELVAFPRPVWGQAPAPAAHPGRPGRLVVRGPDGTTRDFPLETGIVKIGSLASAHLHLEGPDVARLHAVMEVDLESAIVIDLGSATGTWVNGVRLEGKHVLEPGDRLTIGEHVLEVFR